MLTLWSQHLSALVAPASRSTHDASSATPAVELGRAFAAACRQDTTQSERTLHRATVALVEQLKWQGQEPERVVIEVKNALSRFGGCTPPPSLNDERREGGARQAIAYRLVFGWLLEAYFDEAEAVRMPAAR